MNTHRLHPRQIALFLLGIFCLLMPVGASSKQAKEKLKWYKNQNSRLTRENGRLNKKISQLDNQLERYQGARQTHTGWIENYEYERVTRLLTSKNKEIARLRNKPPIVQKIIVSTPKKQYKTLQTQTDEPVRRFVDLSMNTMHASILEKAVNCEKTPHDDVVVWAEPVVYSHTPSNNNINSIVLGFWALSFWACLPNHIKHPIMKPVASLIEWLFGWLLFSVPWCVSIACVWWFAKTGRKEYTALLEQVARENRQVEDAWREW